MAYSYALVLTIRSPGKISNSVKNKATETYVGYVNKQPLHYMDNQWCILTKGVSVYNQGGVFHIGVKFEVARFDTMGNFQDALNREASNEWASRFCLYASNLIHCINFRCEASSCFFIIKIMDRIELQAVEAMYEAPIVEIVEVQVEKGFEGSSDSGSLNDYGNGGRI